MTAYTDFLSDPLRQSVYLAEVHYGNPADSTSGVLYYSTAAFGTAATDTPASQRFDARMLGGYDFASGAEGNDGLGTIAGILPARTGGTLTLAQKLGDLDSLADYSFDGRQIVIRHGGTSPRYGTLPYASFKEVFNGTASGQPLIGVDQVTFQLANKDARFEYPIQDRKHHGGNFALLYDGVNDATDCGTGSTFNFTSGAFTVEFWIRISAAPGAEATIINRGLASAGGTDGWGVLLGTDAKIYVATYQAGATQRTNSSAITTSKWTHVACVRSGAAVTIYLDGVASNLSSATHVNPATASRNLYFGRNNSGTVFLAGMLDDIRISNSARSRSEIVTRMGRQLTAAEIASGYVGCWKHEDGTGTTLTDSSATAANGTISGATWVPSLQGGDELEGAPLIDVWGARFGVPPVLVDAATRIYQVHSGPINAIVGVYEGGNALTLDPSPGTTYTSLTTFLLATTAASKYEVCSTDYGSWIRLGSKPAKPVTIDIEGDKSGGTYRSRASDIWRYIVCNRGPQPLTDPTDLDDAAFTTARSDVTAAVGIDYASDISIAEVGNFLLAGVGLSTWFQRDGGLLTIQRFEGAAAHTAVLDLTENDIELGTFESLNAGAPIWAVDLGWKKNSLVHSTTDIAAAVIGGSRWAFLLQEWRIVGASNPAVRESYKGAKKMAIESGLGTWATARAEADRRLALFANPPQAFRGFFRERATQLDRFSPVTLHFRDLTALGAQQSRFNTSDTAAFVVLALEDDTAKGGTWLTLYREAIA